jgi:hypothetical protein
MARELGASESAAVAGRVFKTVVVEPAKKTKKPS